jgi:hypothetical protein
MPMTMEQRIELLKKAREAKKAKQEERKAEKEANPPPRGRRPKPKPEEKTLDLVDNNQVKDEELDDILKPEPEPEPEPKTSKRTTKKEKVVPQQVQEPEIVEEVETRKIKKPKKRIVRKIIKEQYDSDSTDVSYEEVIYSAPKHRPKQAKAKQVEQPPELPKPIEPQVRQSKPSLNIFGY